ncbi:acyltransferase family protein [Oryzifoliimicrobium ureilyticus]|uniref:acyltransferase family protein n=1 Tax=Oryzifoliimicrobium ureilyticus TaxID=3113724 RepID=UPI0030763770
MKTSPHDDDHYAALDAVRGIAAVSVLLFHLGHWLEVQSIAPNGGLSVDTFFTLSGFVLARAYTRRAATMSMKTFMLIRLIRLTPVIILALLISASYALAKNSMSGGESYIYPIIIAVLLGSVHLPYFHAPSQIGGPQIFPLNGPQFSLFLEIVVNFFWWMLRFLNPLYLSFALYVICTVLVCIVGIGGDTADTFVAGFYHVGSSFFIGVFAYHVSLMIGRRTVLNYLFFALLLIMLIIFLMPVELSLEMRMLWKAVLAPLLVFSGSSVRLPKKAHRASVFIGALSYPFYALHYPIFCWTNGIFQQLTKHRSLVVEGALVFSATVVASYLVIRYVDEPVRRYLTRLARGFAPPVRVPT